MSHVSSIKKVGDEARFYRGREPVDRIRSAKRELRSYGRERERPGSDGHRNGVNPNHTTMRRGSQRTGECIAGARRVASL